MHCCCTRKVTLQVSTACVGVVFALHSLLLLFVYSRLLPCPCKSGPGYGEGAGQFSNS